jgi:hypothetical protein
MPLDSEISISFQDELRTHFVDEFVMFSRAAWGLGNGKEKKHISCKSL